MKELYITDQDFPFLLKHIFDPPKKLYIQGNLPNKDARILCVVGSRQYSSYGKEVTEKLISGLKGYNICIVSGLALGIDSIAHRVALDVGLQTVAFPGSGLDPSVLYPYSHIRLAEEIVASGGGLISEFDPLQTGAIWTFPKRNRLMAGISHATLVIEAKRPSGSLITSTYAQEWNRDTGAVPGSIYSPLSAGPHMLIRNGATPITTCDDLLELVGFARREGQSSLNLKDARIQTLGEIEKKIIHLLSVEPRNRDGLIHELNIPAQAANIFISLLEIEGFIVEKEGVIKLI